MDLNKKPYEHLDIKIGDLVQEINRRNCIMIPHIIVFIDPDCKGEHMHIFNSMPNLPKEFNDTISSFVVLGGRWKMYDEPNFNKPIGFSFTEGIYNFGEKIDQDKLKNWIKNKDGSQILTKDTIETIMKNLEKSEKVDNPFNDIISSIELVGG